jgi:hypothetical protein
MAAKIPAVAAGLPKNMGTPKTQGVPIHFGKDLVK